MNRLDAIRQREQAARGASDDDGVTSTYVPFDALDLVLHARADIPALLELADAVEEATEHTGTLTWDVGRPWADAVVIQRDYWERIIAALAPLLEPEQP